MMADIVICNLKTTLFPCLCTMLRMKNTGKLKCFMAARYLLLMFCWVLWGTVGVLTDIGTLPFWCVYVNPVCGFGALCFESLVFWCALKRNPKHSFFGSDRTRVTHMVRVTYCLAIILQTLATNSRNDVSFRGSYGVECTVECRA